MVVRALRVPEQLVKKWSHPPGQLQVAEAAPLIKRLVDLGDRERGRDRDTPHGQADQSQLGQAIEPAESARRDRDDADWLASQDPCREVVQRILEGTRVSVLVLRCDDQEAVRAGHLRAQFDRSGGRVIGFSKPVAHHREVKVCQVNQRGGTRPRPSSSSWSSRATWASGGPPGSYR